MPDRITPQATPIAPAGEPAWFPPPQDDNQQPAMPPHSGIRHIFFGAEGLRAGWSLLLFLLLLALISFAGTSLAHLLTGNKYMPVRGVPSHPLTVWFYTHGAPLVGAILAAAAMSRVERRPLERYGLGSLRGRTGQALYGFLSGLITFSLLIGVLYSQQLLVFDAKLLTGSAALKWGLIWLATFLCVGFSEEYLTRGYAQFTLSRGLAGIAGALGLSDATRKRVGFRCAALFFSYLFGFGHKGNAGESPVGLWSAGLIGLVFAFSLWRSGSIWWAIAWHGAWDWAESFLYGTADSGGAILHPLFRTHPRGALLLSGGPTGPEGSVFVLGIIALTALLIAFTLKPQPGSPSLPDTWATGPEAPAGRIG